MGKGEKDTLMSLLVLFLLLLTERLFLFFSPFHLTPSPFPQSSYPPPFPDDTTCCELQNLRLASAV